MREGDIVVYKNQIGTVVTDFENSNIFRFLPCNYVKYYGNYSTSILDKITENSVREATHEEKLDVIRKEYHWGRVVKIHCIGEYQIVESIKNDEKSWHGYIDYKDTNTAYSSLDAALVGCIGYKHEGGNGKAAMYFSKMVGME